MGKYYVIFKVNTMERFRLSTARVECDFLLQIGILRAKGQRPQCIYKYVTPPLPRLELCLSRQSL